MKIGYFLLLALSIILNFWLIFSVIDKDENVEKVVLQVANKEIANNVIEFESSTIIQAKDGWPTPNIATKDLEKILNGIEMVISAGTTAKFLSSEDGKSLWTLYAKLREAAPPDQSYYFRDVTMEDKKHLDDISGKLKKVLWPGADDWSQFMTRVKQQLNILQM